MYLYDKFPEVELLCWQRINAFKCYKYCPIAESFMKQARSLYINKE